ncbi:AzlD domain-containing protein [Ralstonia pseudosolanacearum]|uniref:AzlD domain-containing protein n=1 Tax=Ralstonia solanacearum TaxID=305 RepID=A0AA92JU43_RALSL|nr:AzlD domain-containing protein [Ralstonia pseudosolanacearum]QOK92618.1 hypothetical protein HF908_14770 [Ralstonia pseudosolanacearum]QOK97509.1 hypothetical protein HF909_14460 [Ralstonia pseudosolanacearum]UWD90273.1 AzlD domain-containing protein [Ralstonia pseudosolanacearum]CAH0444736.1 hypothetical protein LMG9673_04450 [Ralstonia pseudosolanacearum]
MNQTLFMILAMGATVFVVRSIAFIFANHISLPRFLRESLELLPPAILTVIIANGVLLSKHGTELDLGLHNPYLLATLITILIATRVRNFFVVIACGYAAFLLMTFLMA